MLGCNIHIHPQIFYIYSLTILSNFGWVDERDELLISAISLFKVYIPHNSHFDSFILFLLLLAFTSSPITMLFLQFFYETQFNKLAFTSNFEAVQPIYNYLWAFQKKIIGCSLLRNNRSHPLNPFSNLVNALWHSIDWLCCELVK